MRDVRRWTSSEDRILRNNWGCTNLARLGNLLGRSEESVYYRARALRLPFGVPQGMESLTAAARRVGMDVATLNNAIAWYISRGLIFDRRKTATLRRTNKGAHQALEPDDVDEVVNLWTRSETVRDAARRYGVADTTMRLWLRDANIPAPPKGQYWRMLPQEFDEVALPRIKTFHKKKRRPKPESPGSVALPGGVDPIGSPLDPLADIKNNGSAVVDGRPNRRRSRKPSR